MRELRIDPRDMGLDGAQDYDYAILVDEMQVAEGFFCESYGGKATPKGGGEPAQVANITVSTSRIDGLMELLVRNQVTPLNLRDVIDDWL